MTDASKPPPIVEFLTDRLDEREAFLHLLQAEDGQPERVWRRRNALAQHGVPPHSPDELLADIAAKRAIIAIHEIFVEEKREGPIYSDTWKPDVGCVNCDWDNDCRCIEDNGYPCDTVRHLAAPYADHPDYREEWKAPR